MVGRRILAIVTALAVVAGGLGTNARPADAAQHIATVIVDTGSNVYVRTVTVSPGMSGIDALKATGLTVETRSYGGALGEAVCKIAGVGNPAAQCPGMPFWAYYRAPAGSQWYTMSSMGASATAVRGGDRECWVFGSGGSSQHCPTAPPPAPPPAPSGQGDGSPGSGGTSPSDGGGDPSGASTGGATSAGGRTRATGGNTADRGAPGDDEAAGAAEVEGETTDEEATRDERDDDLEAAPAPTGAAEPSGGGSPLGLVVAALLATALVTAAIVTHRRRMAAAP